MRFLLTTLLGLAGCTTAPPCSSEVDERTYDTASDHYATTEVRNCGATTDYATVVRVGRTSESPNDATEVFVADSNHGQAAYNRKRSIWISVGWTAPGKLSVNYDSQARVFKKLPSAKRAKISYKATEPYSPPPLPNPWY